MGFGHGVEPDAVGDVRMVSLAVFSLRQAERRCALSRQKPPPIATTSGLAERPDRTGGAMTRLSSVTLLFSIVAGGLVSGDAAAGSRPPRDPAVPAALVETSPSLAPFQHVRFCLRYPDDCRSNLAEDERIDLT